ncbi:DUF411 domain-containing protein [Acuticoccus sp. MNP-M23]|uniref:DUF411 domain-containing protein n=1 Tax=Acuticoccus sp. MNP-M23 TaxID=3072793 RepID=UPI0028165E3E|nr:DUF411 domain-containing protein [Acuticoccus sp. MNP-M23]WMS43483.1 DUF411 domain-containing protein [Acuticoccus sp. MNP-M23]
MKMFYAAALAATLAIVAMPGLPRTAHAEPQNHTMHVYKTPWCGCCTSWADHMDRIGYKVEITELEDLAPVRQQAGVPAGFEGCHTAAVEGYVIEGHVPPEAIAKLLKERPAIRGIAVPGMPMGSVGMGNDPRARYDVLGFGGDAAEGASVYYQAGR